MNTDWNLVDWRALGVATHQHFSQVASTNSWATQAASTMAAHEFPLLVTCERQTAGRGRGSRSWWQGDGGLAFSVVLDLEKLGTANPDGASPVHPAGGICLPLVAAVSVQQTAAQFLPNESCRIKWPNDLMVNDRKNAGILIEAVAGYSQRVVVGVGVNVNNAKSSRVAVGDFDAFCWSETGQRFPLEQVVAAFLPRFFQWCSRAAGDTGSLHAAFDAADWLKGKRIIVTSAAAWQLDSQDNMRLVPDRHGEKGKAQFVGAYQGINEHGHLRLADDRLGMLLFPSVEQIRSVAE